MARAIRGRDSLAGNIRLLDDRFPLGDFRDEVRAECLGCAGESLDAQFLEALLEIRRSERSIDLLVEAGNDGARRLRRCAYAVPGRNVVTGHAAFRDGGYVGQPWE